jgi:flagellar hook-basal body complex protein FliE
MSVEALSALAPLAQMDAAPALSLVQPAASTPGFGQMVTQGLQDVNQQLMTSQTQLQQLALGDVQNLHQTMIGLEQARLSFQLLMQVRGRLLEAYQDVMKMQV